jgi:hypothetical protein
MRGIISWLELAMAAATAQEENLAVVLHPLTPEPHQPPGFAVMLGTRCLCGNDGALTVFDSGAAAARFLHLLKVKHVALAAGGDLDSHNNHDNNQGWRNKHKAIERFRLAGNCLVGLAASADSGAKPPAVRTPTPTVRVQDKTGSRSLQRLLRLQTFLDAFAGHACAT